MRAAMPSTAQLSLALHASIPPALFAVLMNAIVLDKTFAVCKFLGELVPSRIRDALRTLYVASNAGFVAAVGLFLWWNCPTATQGTIEHSASEASCLPAHSLVAIALLVLLWADRAMLAFLHAPGTSTSIASRIAKGATCAAFLISVSEKDATSHCFLLLSLLNRSSGSTKWAPKLHGIDRALRTAIASYALYMLSHRTASRRLSAVLIACVFHSR